MAGLAGFSPSTYRGIEFGSLQPTGPQQQALAEALGIRQMDLQSDSTDYWHDYAEAVLSYAEPLADADVDACARLLAKMVIS